MYLSQTITSPFFEIFTFNHFISSESFISLSTIDSWMVDFDVGLIKGVKLFINSFISFTVCLSVDIYNRLSVSLGLL